ncbi:MAG: penicillin-binding protein [Candidatus Neomarinimicrobiota bacterium]|nr:MAG: penicillin-binding protein [Candidatus Neomarinimicrobiota bacterium]
MNIAVKNQKSKKDRIKRSMLILGGLICIFVLIVIIRTYNIYQKDLPSFEKLHNIEPALKTKIYASDGTLLQEYFNENRVLTPYDQIPPFMIDMLMAVEDRKFMDHWGLHPKRIIKALLVDIISWDIAEGASTITQQLARMLFLNRRETIERKIKEALTAIKLERTYSKQEILQMYLNQYFFGRRAYGIAAASRTYFNKSVGELSVSDCALLVGLLKAPGRYSVRIFEDPEFAKRIRNQSLYLYHDWGKMSREEYDSLKILPVELNPPVEEAGRAPYFTEEVRKYILNKYGHETLYSGGLTVITTLDWKLQQVTDSAVKERVDSIQARLERIYDIKNPTYTYAIPDSVDSLGDTVRVYKQIQAAAITIENESGNILAMVGGKSFESTKFNRAVQSELQPGSAFKPFVYTAAMDNGYHPSDIFYDNSIKLEIPGTRDWRPHNFDDKFMGEMTLRDGLKMSRNLIAIKLLLKIKPEQAIFYAHKMGITSDLKPVASLAMGTEVVRLIDLVSAYTVFPNGGIKVPYKYILKITDRYGNVIEDNTVVPKEEVLSARTAYIMVNMMQSVMERGGTGQSARWRGFTRPAGGKTGTSDNFCDNWFIGYTPQITSGVWVGFDEKLSIGKNQTGATNALPIWVKMMIAAHDTLPIVDFEIPDGIEFVDICLESGKLASDCCEKIRNEVYRTENVPQEICPLHPCSGFRISPASKTDNYTDPGDTSDVYHF